MQAFSSGRSVYRGRDLRSLVKRCSIAVTLILSLSAASTVVAQTPPKKPVVEDRTLLTEDEVELKATYYKSTGGKDSPVVILLHGKSETRQKWKGVASVLQEVGGFAVVTVDLRGHGDSQMKTKKIDYQAMAINDLEAVKEFLFEEHQKAQLNMNKLGIVGCDFSASVAMTYAEYDWQKEPYDDSPISEQRTPRGQDVQAIILISPDAATPGLFTSKTAAALRNLEKLAVMVAASERSGHDASTSKKLFDQISLKRVKSDQLSFVKYPEEVRGLSLVMLDDKLKNDIADFLTKYVKELDSKWIDRRSQLDR